MTDLYSRKCALCLESIGHEDDIVMTRDFFAPTDPLSEYANVAMHKRCFMAWNKRDEFLVPHADMVRYHMRTPAGLEIIRFERKHNQVAVHHFEEANELLQRAMLALVEHSHRPDFQMTLDQSMRALGQILSKRSAGVAFTEASKNILRMVLSACYDVSLETTLAKMREAFKQLNEGLALGGGA